MTSRNQLHPVGRAKGGVFHGYIVVTAAAFALFIYGATFYSFGVFFKPVLSEFNWTRAMTSGAFSLNAFLYSLFGILTGKLSEKFSPRTIITVGGVIMGAGYLLMSRITAIWQLYLFYGVFIAVGMGTLYVISLSMPVRWFVRRRGMVTGIVHSGLSLGGVVMPPAASLLIVNYGWRDSYFIVGVVAILWLVVSARFLRREPAEMGLLPYGAGTDNDKTQEIFVSGLSLAEAIRTRRFWIFAVILLAGFLYVDAMILHIVPHATDLGISPTTAAGILAFMSALGLCGKLAMGSASDIFGGKRALVGSFSLMTLALLWLLIARQVWSLYLFAVVFGFGYGGMSVLIPVVVAWLFGIKSHGVIFGVLIFIGALGTVSGPIIAGYIFDSAGSYYPAFWLFIALNILTLALSLTLKSPGKRT